MPELAMVIKNCYEKNESDQIIFNGGIRVTFKNYGTLFNNPLRVILFLFQQMNVLFAYDLSAIY